MSALCPSRTAAEGAAQQCSSSSHTWLFYTPCLPASPAGCVCSSDALGPLLPVCPRGRCQIPASSSAEQQPADYRSNLFTARGKSPGPVEEQNKKQLNEAESLAEVGFPAAALCLLPTGGCARRQQRMWGSLKSHQSCTHTKKQSNPVTGGGKKIQASFLCLHILYEKNGRLKILFFKLNCKSGLVVS